MADATRVSATAWPPRLRAVAQEWAACVRLVPCAPAPAYNGLRFAVGHARLGDGMAARELLGCGRDVPVDQDEAHRALHDAFESRALQALDGRPRQGPLPDSQLRHLEEM